MYQTLLLGVEKKSQIRQSNLFIETKLAKKNVMNLYNRKNNFFSYSSDY